MADKKPSKKTDPTKNKPEGKRAEVRDLDTKKDPKGGPITVGWLPG